MVSKKFWFKKELKFARFETRVFFYSSSSSDIRDRRLRSRRSKFGRHPSVGDSLLQRKYVNYNYNIKCQQTIAEKKFVRSVDVSEFHRRKSKFNLFTVSQLNVVEN